MSEKIVLAGTSSVFGLDEIRKSFAKKGIEVILAEVPYMMKYASIEEKDDTVFKTEFPEDCKIIPLSEYWISSCIKDGNCLISEKALKASRSKRYLYEILSESEIDVPKIFNTVDEARKSIFEGKKIIVKPEGLFAGYGIRIVSRENSDDLEKYIQNALNVKSHAIKLFCIKNNDYLLTECLEGTEYSADIFCFFGKTSIVRICRKKIICIHETPCTAVCAVVENRKFEEMLKTWGEALFSKDDLSFGQFDFIETRDGRIVPIDFACRVGGGMKELLSNCSVNHYAEAVLGNEYHKEFADDKNLTQFNYLPTKSGIIENDDFNLIEGKRYIFKKKGDFVPESPSSIASRIALVVTPYGDIIEENILESLLIGDDYILFWKKK